MDNLGQAATLCAGAFHSDTGFSWCFPDEQRRPAQLAWIFERTLRIGHGFQYIHGIRAHDQRLLGVSVWYPPGAQVSLVRMVRHGLLALPAVAGLRGTPRALTSLSGTERLKEQAMKGRRCWYLDTLAVDVEHQGRGLGGQLVQVHLEQHGGALPSVLVTANERNLIFYQHRGFEVTHEARVGGPDGFQAWAMVREPRGKP